VKDDNTQSFVIRIWHEDATDQQKTVVWHGSIDHVGANKRLYFADLDAVVNFIQERVGMVSRSRLRWAMFWARARRLFCDGSRGMRS
jgi:hypothetical protein